MKEAAVANAVECEGEQDDSQAVVDEQLLERIKQLMELIEVR